jgi:hypothetical protein
MDELTALGRYPAHTEVLHRGKRKDSQSPGDLGELQKQIRLWSSRAAELAPNVMALAFELSTDASQVLFKGDLIVFNSPAGRERLNGLRNKLWQACDRRIA